MHREENQTIGLAMENESEAEKVVEEKKRISPVGWLWIGVAVFAVLKALFFPHVGFST